MDHSPDNRIRALTQQRAALRAENERLRGLLQTEREWWPNALREAERRLRETPECGHSLMEDAWPFMDCINDVIRERAALGEGGSDEG